MVTAVPATEAHIEPWLALAETLEPLFGPMPLFSEAIERGIRRGTAWVTVTAGRFTGGMLLSRPDVPHQIRWLGVLPQCRNEGSGTELVGTALEQWPRGTVDVVTFTAAEPDGRAARRLYERHGFVCLGPTSPAPDGSPRDLFRLTRK
ncbi:GNAT family N-acetyltransferase [Microlunatus sp. Y2014]|uniref:GNAT family N-acetyltransferase n=1 Tax=Microlunatus sp. Y2014 TaxID=3418488 RepID=UPI003DA73484